MPKMTTYDKKALYESIMKDIAKAVMHGLNEASDQFLKFYDPKQTDKLYNMDKDDVFTYMNGKVGITVTVRGKSQEQKFKLSAPTFGKLLEAVAVLNAFDKKQNVWTITTEDSQLTDTFFRFLKEPEQKYTANKLRLDLKQLERDAGEAKTAADVADVVKNMFKFE